MEETTQDPAGTAVTCPTCNQTPCVCEKPSEEASTEADSNVVASNDATVASEATEKTEDEESSEAAA
jgi:hypothetical protein